MKRTEHDEVLVIATDGLWDVFSCKVNPARGGGVGQFGDSSSHFLRTAEVVAARFLREFWAVVEGGCCRLLV